MNARKALAAWYKLDPKDLVYCPARSGSIRIGNSVMPMAWEPCDSDSGWWRRGTEGQYAGFAIPVAKEILKYAKAVRPDRSPGPRPSEGRIDAPGSGFSLPGDDAAS